MTDIDVDVQTEFLWEESDPAQSRFVFGYTVTITNNSPATSKLINRHWLITNGDGQREVVEGTGVVGRQPTLSPGQSFRYSSGAILETPFGVMEGYYEFIGEAGEKFDVPINAFILSIPEQSEN